MQGSFPNPVTEIIDLSHEFYEGMPNGGGWTVAFPRMDSFDRVKLISDNRVGYETKMILLPEHCGTHLDVPRHVVEEGKTVDQIPLEQLVLPGHLLDFSHKQVGEAITVEDFEAAEEKSGQKVGPGTALVCWTGVDKVWSTPGYGRKRPFIPTVSAQWMVDRGVTLFATDLIGMDDPAEWWDPTHHVWLSNGICMVQQLCNLDKLVGKKFLFVALPMKIVGGTGCPIRAAALVL